MERALERDLATPPVTGEVGELVERLRAAAKVGAESCNIVAQKLANGYEEAAAMLERYAAENARLREELEHFVDIVDGTDETGFDPHVEQMLMDATETARATLSNLPNTEQPS